MDYMVYATKKGGNSDYLRKVTLLDRKPVNVEFDEVIQINLEDKHGKFGSHFVDDFEVVCSKYAKEKAIEAHILIIYREQDFSVVHNHFTPHFEVANNIGIVLIPQE